jgi:hypothetical protein
LSEHRSDGALDMRRFIKKRNYYGDHSGIL